MRLDAEITAERRAIERLHSLSGSVIAFRRVSPTSLQSLVCSRDELSQERVAIVRIPSSNKTDPDYTDSVLRLLVNFRCLKSVSIEGHVKLDVDAGRLLDEKAIEARFPGVEVYEVLD
jgi:hypothetical protein